MKKIIILMFLLLGINEASQADTVAFAPLQPLAPLQTKTISPIYNPNNAIGTNTLANPFAGNYSQIDQIELSLFGRNYPNQTIALRLGRIEKSLFTTTYPNSTTTQRIDNIISNFNQINKFPNISRNELSRLESKILSQTYPQNNSLRRIERLEQQLFGAKQTGDADSRLEALRTASRNYNNTYANANLNQGGWKGIASAIGSNLLGGTMTGYTPMVSPLYNNYNNYNAWGSPMYNNYPTGGYGMYRGYRSNHGYVDDFQNFSSGTGVTILD